MINHNETIRQSFKKQAEKFAKYHMSKSEYTDYLVHRIESTGKEHALEVAAGTCICGRALAPFVKEITCLDITEEMLAEGKKLAEEQHVLNINFEIGKAEDLPYDSESFDLVVTRLSFHHFGEPEKSFNEMQRVLKKGGKLVIWDMEATEESLRSTNDKIEKMRDPSHIKILSKEEFKKMFYKNFTLQCVESTLVPVKLTSWLELTDTPIEIQNEITNLIKNELSGGSQTGFYPYSNQNEIMFDHKWILFIGIKKE